MDSIPKLLAPIIVALLAAAVVIAELIGISRAGRMVVEALVVAGIVILGWRLWQAGREEIDVVIRHTGGGTTHLVDGVLCLIHP